MCNRSCAFLLCWSDTTPFHGSAATCCVKLSQITPHGRCDVVPAECAASAAVAPPVAVRLVGSAKCALHRAAAPLALRPVRRRRRWDRRARPQPPGP
eukprot:1100640-Prymnesium_polylepis.1